MHPAKFPASLGLHRDAAAFARNLVDCIASPPIIEPAILSRFSKDVALDAIEVLADRLPSQSRHATNRAS
jgi:hypothetical protein